MSADKSRASCEVHCVELVIHGPVALRAPDGADLTPKPQKARALLGLLATAPDMRRSRRWIEARLWSDRGAAQAAGSLRQALVDLRKALGPHAHVLISTRESVGLAAGAVRVLPPAGGTFLEDVTVRDPAFLRWLEAQRSRPDTPECASAPPAPQFSAAMPQEPVRIRIGTPGQTGTPSGIVAEILAARVATAIADRVTAGIVLRGDGPPPPGCDIDVTCTVIEQDGVCLALLKVIHVPSARVIHACDTRFTGTAASLAGSEELVRCAFAAAEATVLRVSAVLGVSRAAAAPGRLDLQRMFTRDEAALREADRLMERAWEADENPVHLAWRGLLQMLKGIEMPQSFRPELHALAQRLTALAMERDDGTATLEALVAQTRAMLFADAAAAGGAAVQAVRDDPRNPFALQALAVARMLAGDGEEAYRSSLLARSYAGRPALRHWWEAHHATICVATGRTAEAIRAAEAARFAAPLLRPAYRFLMALHAWRGEFDRAHAMRAELDRLEPGVTVDHMPHDPDYPVRPLRNSGLHGEVRKPL